MSFLRHFKAVTTFVFDVDGVLTDGSILIFDDGQQIRRMNIKDGYALQLAIERGYRVVIVSGADCPAVAIRLEKLGINKVFMGVKNKKALVERYLQDEHIPWDQVLFMGDDIPDYELMQYAGMPCAPADAVSEIRQAAKYISSFAGGAGCVRDVIEKVLKVRGQWRLDTSISSK